VESLWLMRCHYCGATITPPDWYRGEVPGVARGEGVEVTVQADGAGPSRVEYVFVLCPLCVHTLYTKGWIPLTDSGAEDGVWMPLLPPAHARVQVGSGRGGPAPLDLFSSAPPGRPRSARGGRPQAPGARQGARSGTGSRHSDHEAPGHDLRLVELVVLVLCVAVGVGMIGAAVFLTIVMIPRALAVFFCTGLPPGFGPVCGAPSRAAQRPGEARRGDSGAGNRGDPRRVVLAQKEPGHGAANTAPRRGGTPGRGQEPCPRP
jgi:hypothetical protein